MKKAFVKGIVLLFAVSLVLSAFTGCAKRDEILKVYNWGEYMDEDVCDDFESWYTEQTGKTVRVEYKEYDTNESMYTEIAIKKADYDLVCPSDYMIARMIDEELVQPLDKSVFDPTAAGADGAKIIDEALLEMVRAFDADNAYTVPFFWGTFGILYDKSRLDATAVAGVNSWELLWDTSLRGNVSMKDSERDSYSVAIILANVDSLKGGNAQWVYDDAYKSKLNSLFNEVSDASIAAAEARLTDQVRAVNPRYEVDDGKMSLQAANDNTKLGLYWSCDAGFVMNDGEDDDGNQFTGNKNLWYSVPDEGSNVWVDGFVIPKYAKNVAAANWFLKYLCETDVAVKNMEYVGSTTAVAAAAAQLKAALEEEETTDPGSVFYGTEAGWKEMYLEMMFPTEATLNRCAVMGDFGRENNIKLQDMWQRVRATSAN